MAAQKVNFNRIQWTAWLILYLLLLMYYIRERDTMMRGIIAASANFGFSLLAIYGQSHFLMPRFLKFKWRYAFASLFTLVVLVIFKTISDYLIFNHFFDHRPFQLNLHHSAVTVLTIFLCFIIGFLMRISLDHVKLLQHQEKLHRQQLMSEINLLKAQVQPHFMFNTLNNIYSLAYRGSEKTAEVVAKLSDIMRYFVHDAPLEKVPISTEISFITSYIELERIRIPTPLIVDLK